MRIPILAGTIKRRLLINFRADPGVVGRLLPAPFRPKPQGSYAVIGICLIRLEHQRPHGMPELLGVASEDAAHRFAVEWTEPDGSLGDGVYVPRRDTSSLLNQFAGGRIFPVKPRAAKFNVTDVEGHIDFSMRSQDGEVSIEVGGDESDMFPADSCFPSLQAASDFFRCSSTGYSPSKHSEILDGIELRIPEWRVGAFEITKAKSSYFENPRRFPPGSLEFDHALIMRDTRHEWRIVPDMNAEAVAGNPTP